MACRKGGRLGLDPVNKLLVTLSKIGTQQKRATKATATAINQLMEYVVTYPNNGINYISSNMRLAAHYGAAYTNISKARSQAGAHIFL